MSGRHGKRMTLLVAAWCAVAGICVSAESGRLLIPPPKMPETTGPIEVVAEISRASVPIIDNFSRSQVVALFNSAYLPSEGVAANWTGNVAACTPGTTDIAYEDATLLRVNYFRAMAGLPGNIVFSATNNAKCQQAALMMIAEGNLSHTPGTSWACYTDDGREAAGKSNLALGSAGADSIALYIEDEGTFNTAVGHRRWILYPPQQTMATGSTTAVNGFYHGSNALWVLGPFGARPGTPEWVGWPPAGYVPYPVVYPRWSFSRQGADFSGATVSMTHQGNPVSLSIYPIATGYGDNTVVWLPVGIPSGAPGGDLTYTVTVGNVLVSAAPRNYTYTVTIIDPDAVGLTGARGSHWPLYE